MSIDAQFNCMKVILIVAMVLIAVGTVGKIVAPTSTTVHVFCYTQGEPVPCPSVQVR